MKQIISPLMLCSLIALAAISPSYVRADGPNASIPWGYVVAVKDNSGNFLSYEDREGWRMYTTTYHADETCPDGHVTPPPYYSNFEHIHIDRDFPLLPVETGATEDVPAVASDAYWATRWVYSYFTQVSGSTFYDNCYSYVTSSGTPMDKSAWEAWTEASAVCEVTTAYKSFVMTVFDAPQDHVVGVAYAYQGENGCVLQSTQEKLASGPVFSYTWDSSEALELYNPQEVRKLRPW